MMPTNVSDAPNRREQRKLQHQELSRIHVLEAAEEAFGRRGFHETTVKEIASLANFSVASVYLLFEGKEQLFREIFLHRGREFLPGLRATLATEGTPVEQLHRLIDFNTTFHRDRPNFRRFFLRYSASTAVFRDGLVDEAMAASFEETIQLQADLIRRGQQEGQFRPGDAMALSRLLMGLFAAYHAVDAIEVSGELPSSNGVPLTTFHDMVEGAFAPSASRPEGSY